VIAVLSPSMAWHFWPTGTEFVLVGLDHPSGSECQDAVSAPIIERKCGRAAKLARIIDYRRTYN
jgi:hypothetical protein